MVANKFSDICTPLLQYLYLNPSSTSERGGEIHGMMIMPLDALTQKQEFELVRPVNLHPDSWMWRIKETKWVE